MSYLNYVLEPGDCYINRYTGINLPNDSLLKDPERLAELSGPVTVYQLGEVKQDENSMGTRSHDGQT